MDNRAQIWTEWAKAHYEKALEYYQGLEDIYATGKRPEWHAGRSCCITGTDMAKLSNLSPYGEPLQVFKDKTLQREPFSGSIRTRMGNACEHTVAQIAAEMLGGKLLPGINAQPKSRPWCRSQIDAVIDCPQFGLIPCEIKCSTFGAGFGPGAKFENGSAIFSDDGEVPPYYYVQVLKQLADLQGVQYRPNAYGLQDCTASILAAYVKTKEEVRLYLIKTDFDQIEQINEIADDFMFNYLIPNVEPPKGVPEQVKDLASFISQPGDYVRNDEAAALVGKYQEILEQKRVLEDQAEDCKNRLCLMIGSHEGVRDANGVLATWKSQTARRLDTKALKAELPAVYEQFAKESTSRVFRLK